MERQPLSNFIQYRNAPIFADDADRGIYARDDFAKVWRVVEDPRASVCNVWIPVRDDEPIPPHIEYKPGSVADQEAAMVGGLNMTPTQAAAEFRANGYHPDMADDDAESPSLGVTSAQASVRLNDMADEMRTVCREKFYPGPGLDAVFCHRTPSHADEPFENFPKSWHLDRDRKWSWGDGNPGTMAPRFMSDERCDDGSPHPGHQYSNVGDSPGTKRICPGRSENGLGKADDSFWINVGIDATLLPQHTQSILREIVAPAVQRWATKNVEYGDTANTLGSKGQFADINRKVGKLKRLMWDKDVPEWAISEGVEEVIQDLIGHCILSIHYIRLEAMEEGARREA